MFNSSTAERCIGEINTRPPVIFSCPRGICPRHAMTNKAKLWFHASLPLPILLRYESDESNPTPSLRSMSILFPSYISIFQVLSFLQIFSSRSCPVCIRFLSRVCHIPPWLYHPQYMAWSMYKPWSSSSREFSPASCYFLPLSSKLVPPRRVLEHRNKQAK